MPDSPLPPGSGSRSLNGLHDSADLTTAESKWIAEFKALAKRCPASLMLFSASSLYIGDARIHQRTGKLLVLDTIEGIYHDGGDPDGYEEGRDG